MQQNEGDLERSALGGSQVAIVAPICDKGELVFIISSDEHAMRCVPQSSTDFTVPLGTSDVSMNRDFV